MVDTSTQSTLPQQNSTFFSDLETFLAEEDALRFQDTLNPFVLANGLHGTGGSLVGDPGNTTAYPGGFFVNETGTITYNDDTTHHWVIIHKDIVTVIGGNWIRVSGTHYLFDPVSAAQPTAPADSLIIMDVVTASGSITTVTDLRNLSAFAVVNDVFKVKISSDDTTADFLLTKLAAGTGITLTETTPGGNETVTIDSDAQVVISTNDTTRGFLQTKIVSGDGIIESVLNAFGNEQLRLAIDLSTTSGLELTAGELQVNTVTNGVVEVTANGTVVNVNGLSATTVVDETLDEVLIWDDSQTGEQHRKVAMTNFLPNASQAQAEAGTLNTGRMTPLRVAQAINGYAGRAELFTANGTYNVPDGITSVLVEAVGGGGGGGAFAVSDGGGGGGGGWIKAVATVSAGGTETVTVGAGGVGNNPGATGGASTFGTLVTALGGTGGAQGNAGGAGGVGGAGSTTGTLVLQMNGENGTDQTFGAEEGGAPGNLWGGMPAAGGAVREVPFDANTLGTGGQGGQGSGSGFTGIDGYILVTPLL